MKTGTIRPTRPAPPLPARLFRYARFWVAFGAVFLADQLTKLVVVFLSGFDLGLYPPFGGMVVIPGFFNLVYAVNYGAAWGMLEGFSWLLVLLAVLVLVLIAVFRRELSLSRHRYQWCFGMICGGILGNTVDRLLRGHVVDFLDFHLPWYRWPTFNLADSGIVLGTLLYLFYQFREGRQKGP